MYGIDSHDGTMRAASYATRHFGQSVQTKERNKRVRMQNSQAHEESCGTTGPGGSGCDSSKVSHTDYIARPLAKHLKHLATDEVTEGKHE